MSPYSPIKGNKNMFPEDHKYLTFLKKTFRHELRKNGFRRITVPILEDDTIMEKVFPMHDDKLCRTPYGTMRKTSNIGVMKAYLDAGIDEEIQPVYYYYMDRFFSRSGETGYSETHRIGGKILGEKDPILDAILMSITYSILHKICLGDTFELRINSVGTEKEKDKYREELVSFFENKKQILSEASLKKLEIDPILIFDSKDEDDKILCQQAPSIIKFLKKESKSHYAQLKEYLDILGVQYTEDNTIFGGYDYNTRSIWEFRELETGALIGAGSRYDALSTKMGITKEIPATGFSVDAGMIMDMLRKKDIKIKNKDKTDLYFVQLGDEAKKVVLPLSLQAREAGINTVVSLGTPSMKEQMLKANRSDSKFVVMVGVMEARNGMFQVRDMEAGTQAEVKKEDIISYVIEKLGDKKLDFYCPAKDLMVD